MNNKKNSRPKLPEDMTTAEKMRMFLPEEQINELGYKTEKEFKDGSCHHKLVKIKNK